MPAGKQIFGNICDSIKKVVFFSVDLPYLSMILLDIEKRSTAGRLVELYVVSKGRCGLLYSSLCYRALVFEVTVSLKKKSSACR